MQPEILQNPGAAPVLASSFSPFLQRIQASAPI